MEDREGSWVGRVQSILDPQQHKPILVRLIQVQFTDQSGRVLMMAQEDAVMSLDPGERLVISVQKWVGPVESKEVSTPGPSTTPPYEV